LLFGLLGGFSMALLGMALWASEWEQVDHPCGGGGMAARKTGTAYGIFNKCGVS
jgi:hypothetical protein